MSDDTIARAEKVIIRARASGSSAYRMAEDLAAAGLLATPRCACDQWTQFATRSHETAERVARHGLVEHPLTDAQYLVLRNCGVLRTDAEVKSFDTWEQAGSPEVHK